MLGDEIKNEKSKELRETNSSFTLPEMYSGMDLTQIPLLYKNEG